MPLVFINELLPSPVGADADEEWIELFNSESFAVELNGWTLKDSAGKITTYTFPENTRIPAHGFLLLPRKETKITLNNDQDGLTLFSAGKTVVHSLTYTTAPTGESFNYLPATDSWEWNAVLTPNAENAKKAEAEPEETASMELASEPLITENHSLFLTLLAPAFLFSFFAAAAFFFLERKLRN